MPKAEVGERALDVRVIDARGREVILSTFWQDRPAVAVFLRHYG